MNSNGLSAPQHQLLLLAEQSELNVMTTLLQSCQAPPCVLDRTLELLIFNAYAFDFHSTDNLDQQIQARAHCL